MHNKHPKFLVETRLKNWSYDPFGEFDDEIMLRKSNSLICSLFVVILLTTEFFYIKFAGGGVARIYHFVAPILLVVLSGSFSRLFRSRVFIFISLFAMVNFIAAAFSDKPTSAFLSLFSFYANCCVFMVVALMLLSRRVSLEHLLKIMLNVTLVSVCLSFVQILLFKVGYNLSFSAEQEAQILIGFGPAFRTEANTFGKYLAFAFLILLPSFINDPKKSRLGFPLFLMLLGSLFNFTRTAMYGVFVAVAFFLVWKVFGRGDSKTVIRLSRYSVSALVVGAIVFSGVLPVAEYAVYKFQNLFNAQEIVEGDSSGFRLQSMDAVLQTTFSDAKRIIIGNGWGQTYVVFDDVEVQAGGGDFINIFGYGGVIGLFFYLLYTYSAVSAALKVARKSTELEERLIAEGVVIALVGMFFTGLMSGYLISPEYFLLLGICVYLSFRIGIRTPSVGRVG